MSSSPTRFCAECGAAVASGSADTFCMHCGTPLGGDPSAYMLATALQDAPELIPGHGPIDRNPFAPPPGSRRPVAKLPAWTWAVLAVTVLTTILGFLWLTRRT